MDLSLNPEMTDVSARARQLAERAGHSLSSAHLLLAFFTISNRAARFLEDRGVSAEQMLQASDSTLSEPVDTLDAVHDRAERIARGSHAEAIGPLHVLAALVRETRSCAYEVLERTDDDVRDLRTTVMSYATGALDLPEGESPASHSIDQLVEVLDRYDADPFQQSDPSSPDAFDYETGSTPIDVHPSLGSRRNRDDSDDASSPDDPRRSDRDHGSLSSSTSPPPSRSSSSGSRTRTRPPGGSLEARGDGDETTSSSGGASKESESTTRDDASTDRDGSDRTDGADDSSPRESESRDDASSVDEETDDADEPTPTDEFEREARDTAQSLAEQLFESSDPDETSDELPPDGGASVVPSEPSESDDTDETSPTPEQERSSDDVGPAPEHRDSTSPPSREDDEPPSDSPRATSDDTTGGAAADLELEPDPALASAYRLDPDQFPNLVDLGRNLTREAALGELDPVVGREDEILELMDVLGKRRANNPMLVGEPGVGKTAIVEGLARRFARMASEGRAIGERIVLELELGRVLSGTELRGSFSERLVALKDEVERAGGDIVVFLDEIHTWMEAGGDDGASAADELKTAMARGHFPCIGATTNEEFRTFVESDPAFQRRCQVVLVEEPDLETTLEIVRGLRPHYEDHHGVDYTDEGLEAAVRLSRRYIHDRQLPDKAIGVIDLAGSRATRTGTDSLGRRDMAEVVADMAGLPVDRLTRDDRDRYLDIESHLHDHIVGQDHVVEAVSEVVRRNYAGFRSERPIGSLLFLGPTGVGKTETVKVLAGFLFHDRDAVVQIDMSEYMESHAVSRFVGAPPGYVGHDQGGQLTEEIRRRPYQIVLLDEIEKAHPDVLNVLLQLFEEGRLTDGKGRDVDFSNALVVMTSNLGSEVFEEAWNAPREQHIGFGATDATSDLEAVRGRTDDVLGAARDHFSPELWNRIDEALVFDPLDRDDLADIAALQLEESAERIASESGVDLVFDDSLVPHLIDNGGYEPELGARPMRQTIQRLVENEVAEVLLQERAERGDTIRVDVRDGEVVCETVA